jgi:hypothetical protein
MFAFPYFMIMVGCIMFWAVAFEMEGKSRFLGGFLSFALWMVFPGLTAQVTLFVIIVILRVCRELLRTGRRGS